MPEKTTMEKIALALSVLLFAGIYVAGFVMSMQEMAQKLSEQSGTSPQGGVA